MNHRRNNSTAVSLSITVGVVAFGLPTGCSMYSGESSITMTRIGRRSGTGFTRSDIDSWQGQL